MILLSLEFVRRRLIAHLLASLSLLQYRFHETIIGFKFQLLHVEYLDVVKLLTATLSHLSHLIENFLLQLHLTVARGELYLLQSLCVPEQEGDLFGMIASLLRYHVLNFGHPRRVFNPFFHCADLPVRFNPLLYHLNAAHFVTKLGPHVLLLYPIVDSLLLNHLFVGACLLVEYLSAEDTLSFSALRSSSISCCTSGSLGSTIALLILLHKCSSYNRTVAVLPRTSTSHTAAFT